MKLHKNELSKLYKRGLIEDLYYADRFILCVIGGKCPAAMIKSDAAYKSIGSHAAFIIDGKTAFAMVADNDLFIAKAISRTDPYEKLIHLNERAEEELNALPPMDGEDTLAVKKLKSAYAEKYKKLERRFGRALSFSEKNEKRTLMDKIKRRLLPPGKRKKIALICHFVNKYRAEANEDENIL